ncbi:MAG: precorrin-4 C(11)-methyltransferase [Verrucomicrobia bacterium]|nr:precorrin-4 C(11)-methyltransferase [Verrucomicrobiota bacterium]
MKVYFIGAGPGAADLITIRGAEILSRARLVMYAGSLVSEAMLSHCRANPLIVNTAKLNLDEQVEFYLQAKERDWDVARLHSGDPSIYGATAEQMRGLRELEIEYEVVPGVPSFVASAAVLQTELTKPNISQTIILTRTSGRASPVPAKENLRSLAAHQATLCIFLSGANLPEVIEELSFHYPKDTPVALVQRASWPEERSHRGRLGELLSQIEPRSWLLTTMLLVGRTLDENIVSESRLYAADYTHRFRRATKNEPE